MGDSRHSQTADRTLNLSWAQLHAELSYESRLAPGRGRPGSCLQVLHWPLHAWGVGLQLADDHAARNAERSCSPCSPRCGMLMRRRRCAPRRGWGWHAACGRSSCRPLPRALAGDRVTYARASAHAFFREVNARSIGTLLALLDRKMIPRGGTPMAPGSR